MGCVISSDSYEPGVISDFDFPCGGETVMFSCQDPGQVLLHDNVPVDGFSFTCPDNMEEDITVSFNLRCEEPEPVPTTCNMDFAELANNGVLAYEASMSIEENFLHPFPITDGMYTVDDGQVIIFSCIEPGQDLLKSGNTLLPGHIDLDFYPYVCDPNDAFSGNLDFQCVQERRALRGKK